MSEEVYHIEDVADRTGLSKRAIRYYEEVELLTPQSRSEGNYRLYSGAELERLQRIVTLKEALGYSLDEIREVLSAEDELASIRTAHRAAGELPELITSGEQALVILHREAERATRKLEQIAAVRRSYQERADRLTSYLAELKAGRRPAPRPGDPPT